MKPWILVLTLAAFTLATGSLLVIQSASSADELEWTATASYVDACCCAPSCPCLFGSPPTLGFCEGITLIDFDEAHYGDVNLDGLRVMAVYRSREWIKFYVDDDATPEQTRAAVELLPAMEGFFAVDNVVEVKNVPIDVEREEGRIKVSTPNTTAHVEVMKGLNGKPIQIVGLPAPKFPGPPFLDHTQYKTILLKHESEEQNYEHSGTNSYTAMIDVHSGEEH